MRNPLNKERLVSLLKVLGEGWNSPGRIYVTGGATALLHGWREMTVDLDLKANPEPEHFFEVIAKAKDRESANIELASPDQFVPALPGWEDRSIFIERYGKSDFYHYDPYGQVLSKIERNHVRDLHDVDEMVCRGLVNLERLMTLFIEVKAQCLRYPAIDADDLESKLGKLIEENKR